MRKKLFTTSDVDKNLFIGIDLGLFLAKSFFAAAVTIGTFVVAIAGIKDYRKNNKNK